MTMTTLFLALVVTSAAGAPGEPVLLDFQATWCGPCQEMRPEIDKLVRNGYPVKAIDIDRSPALAERYGVKAVPTFIVVDADGRSLAKTSGKMPALQLARFYNETKARLAPPAGPVEARDDQPATDAAPEPADTEASPPPVTNPKPWETVVRIKMHLSSSEWGFGSGTIIYSDPDQSIILTCAHIFKLKVRDQPKPKDFRVPITVDLFDGQLTGRQPAMIRCAQADIPGEAIDYDFTNDVGLIRIRPGRALPASRVVPPDWQAKRGMKMYAVGCSHGNDATAWDTTILDPRVGMSNTGTRESFATIKCAFQPKEGRSGGGLYTTDGYVAGVCDFADPNEHVGLYAVPEAIHRMLDRNRLMALYRRDGDKSGRMLAANPPRARTANGTTVRAQNDSESEPALASTANREDIMIPRPQMLGIDVPRVATNTPTRPVPWQASRTNTAVGNANARRTTRPPENLAKNSDEAIDPGAPTPRGEAVPTDLSGEPSAESRAFAEFDARLGTPQPEVETPVVRPPASTRWKPVRPSTPR